MRDPTREVSEKRLALIDGLRGIAACAVVLYHFNDRLNMGSLLGVIAGYGFLGVALFFVLSGFVISMSIGDTLIDRRFLGYFALRRSVRLDPPYWCSMILIIAIGVLGARFGAHQQVPTAGTVIAHLFYLQDILHLQPISPIYWSLCLEIQFYLFIALLLWSLQRGQLPSERLRAFWPQCTMFVTVCVSLLLRHFSIGGGTFVQMWFCFGLGAVNFWAYRGWVSRGYAFGTTVITLVAGVFLKDVWAIAAAVSALLIFAAAKTNRLDMLGNAVSQFLGKISYSIYLTHVIFGWYSLSIAMRYLPAYLAFAVASAVCIISAWIWYRVIEKPSVNLSRKITAGHHPTQKPVSVES